HTIESVSPPHRTSPPFPYTTLFRSQIEGRALGVHGNHLAGQFLQARQRGGVQAQDAIEPRLDARQEPGEQHQGLMPRCRATMPPDRKSTRLNSSHVKISYAVFCLKN